MRRQIPSTNALLCFEAAAKLQSFARAAEALELTQSAVSRQIQSLESYVGQSLFTRARQRVQLTAAGQGLLAELSPLLEDLELAIRKVKTRELAGETLNLGIYPTLGSRWLMPMLMGPQAETWRSALNLVTFLANAEIDPSRVDLAIVQGDAPFAGFRADALMPESLMVVGATGVIPQPVEDPHDLLDQPILRHATRPLSWEIWFRSQGLRLERPITGPLFSQFEMLIDAAKAGHGIAIVPRVLIRQELAEGSLQPLHPFEARTESAYYLLTPDSKVGAARVEQLRSWLLHQVRRDAPDVL